jgi:hypothetical protein
MMRPAAPLRRPGRLARAFALAASLLLLVGVVLTGAHQHERTSASHPCAICTLGHAAATAPVVVANHVTAPRTERVLVERALTPPRAHVVCASSRAPPAA